MKWIENIKTKMPGILLAFLLIVVIMVVGAFIQVHNKLEELGNQLMYLQDTNSILNEQIFSLQTNIEAALEEESSLIESYSVKVLNLDLEKETYQVNVSVVPKEYSNSTRTSVFFGVNEFPLVLNRYTFEGMIELPFSDVYDGNITFLFSNGDKKNTEIAKDYVGIQTKLQELLYGSIEKIPTYRNGQLLFNHSVEYSLNEYEGQEYESLELVLMADEEELKVVNLLTGNVDFDAELLEEEESEGLPSGERSRQEDENEDDEQQEVSNDENGNSNELNDVITQNANADSEEQNIVLGSRSGTNPNNAGETNGNSNPSDEMEENDTNSDNDTSREEIEPTLGKSGIIRFTKNVKIPEGKKVRLFLRAKNKVGFILEYDLFSAVTSKTGPNGYEETTDYFVPNYTIYDEHKNMLKL